MDEEQIREIVREELAEQNGGDEQAREQPRVGRRGVLGSLAAAAGLGAAGYYATQPVAASTHSGEVGTPNKLQRIWAETVRDANDDAMLDFTNGNVDFRNNSATNLASLSTEEAIIGQHAAVTGIEAGRVTTEVTIPAASNDGWDSDNTDISTDVSFGSAFDSTPIVLVSLDRNNTSSGSIIRAWPRKESATGFTLQLANYGTEESTTQVVNWCAIGN